MKLSSNIVAVSFAAVIAALAFNGFALGCLPALYILSVTSFRQAFFENFWAVPLLAALVFSIERTDILRGNTNFSEQKITEFCDTVLPLALSIAFHYTTVYFAKSARKRFARDIDSVCTRISDFLVVRCYEQRTLPSFLYMKSERVLIAVSCTLKIIFALVYLILFLASHKFPQLFGCSSTQFSPSNDSGSSRAWLWGMFFVIFLSEV